MLEACGVWCTKQAFELSTCIGKRRQIFPDAHNHDGTSLTVTAVVNNESLLALVNPL
jgi:hypothetical protein